MTIMEDRLALLDSISLRDGSHGSFEEGVCALEATAWLAGEAHSDHPQCVSPVIAAFGRSWNDGLPTDEDRDRLLKPLLPLMIGTNTGLEDDVTRGWMATDWLIRVDTPAWLRLAGLDEQADRLANLAEIRPDNCPSILEPLQAIRKDAVAKRVEAERAAWAAWAAWAAEAAEAAWAAGAAEAAWAAWAALAPTVAELQGSAQDLLRRMCAVGRSRAS